MTIGTIAIEQTDDGEYIVSDDGTDAYGSGDTLAEAIRDYVLAVLVVQALRGKESL